MKPPRIPAPSSTLSPTRLGSASRPLRRSYYSPSAASVSPYPPLESALLSSALTYVPTHGFTATSLRLGALSSGLSPSAPAVLPAGPYELIRYHLVRERLALSSRVQFPQSKLSVAQKFHSLILSRLRANAERGLVPRWHEALALMAVPHNIAPSLRELAALSDEIVYLAGDASVDESWYAKRAAIAGVYGAAEVFMIADTSSSLSETEQFVQRRLEGVEALREGVGAVGEWVGFTGRSLVNLGRSWGVRI